MTFRELKQKVHPSAQELKALAEEAEADGFAPWVVEALHQAAFFASLSDEAIIRATEILYDEAGVIQGGAA